MTFVILTGKRGQQLMLHDVCDEKMHAVKKASELKKLCPDEDVVLEFGKTRLHFDYNGNWYNKRWCHDGY